MKITSPEAAMKAIIKLFPKDPIVQDREMFFVLTLNQSLKLLYKESVAMGATEQLHTAPREIFRRAITLNASAIIIAHNHPDGDLEPSKEDLETTKSLVASGHILSIVVLDHMIFANKSKWVSLKDDHANLFEFSNELKKLLKVK